MILTKLRNHDWAFNVWPHNSALHQIAEISSHLKFICLSRNHRFKSHKALNFCQASFSKLVGSH